MTNLIEKIHENIHGNMKLFETPFGERQITYADFTASGKSLKFVEEYIEKQILPFYANTHTITSITGIRSSKFREEARNIIADATGCDPDKDTVLFCGSGCTGAISTLVDALHLKYMHKGQAVVFVGPFEHHSNILPWKETNAKVVMIPEKDGKVDMHRLKTMLVKYSSRSLKIGTFTAVSNITGVQSNTEAISSLLHEYGALSFWDYASAAPYVAIHMNSSVNDSSNKGYKDAIFFSGHKFIGGPGSPGVLIVKNHVLYRRKVPSQPGGGTVLYVTESCHRYLDDIIERNEGGTPNVLGSIRLGIAFRLKQEVGIDLIEKRELQNTRHVMNQLRKNPNIVLLGSDDDTRLPIFTFVIKYHNLYLHHNFVCTLLNDLFGIQARGGCQCAGPYSMRLMGIQKKSEGPLIQAIIESPAMKPGFIRVSYPYFLSSSDVQYITNCIDFIGNHGWKFLRLYEFNYTTGAWTYPLYAPRKDPGIADFDFFTDSTKSCLYSKQNQDLRRFYLEEAHKLCKDYLKWNNNERELSPKCISFDGNLRWVAFESDTRANLSPKVLLKDCFIDPSRYHIQKANTSFGKAPRKGVRSRMKRLFNMLQLRENTKV